MKKEEILKVAERCIETGHCQGCPLLTQSCSETFAKYITEQEKEKEPAPPESDTSSNQKKFLQEHNNTISARCQEKIDKALDRFDEVYSNLSDIDKNIWDTGKVNRMLEEIKEELK